MNMKTKIFSDAISNRNQIRFLYGTNEVVLEPYYIAKDNSGKKVIYGRVSNTSEVKKFAYSFIANIKILRDIRFSPKVNIIS